MHYYLTKSDVLGRLQKELKDIPSSPREALLVRIECLTWICHYYEMLELSKEEFSRYLNLIKKLHHARETKRYGNDWLDVKLADTIIKKWANKPC